MLNNVFKGDNKAGHDFSSGIIFIILIFFLILVELRGIWVGLVEVEEEHKNRQEIISERKQAA